MRLRRQLQPVTISHATTWSPTCFPAVDMPPPTRVLIMPRSSLPLRNPPTHASAAFLSRPQSDVIDSPGGQQRLPQPRGSFQELRPPRSFDSVHHLPHERSPRAHGACPNTDMPQLQVLLQVHLHQHLTQLTLSPSAQLPTTNQVQRALQRGRQSVPSTNRTLFPTYSAIVHIFKCHTIPGGVPPT